MITHDEALALSSQYVAAETQGYGDSGFNDTDPFHLAEAYLALSAKWEEQQKVLDAQRRLSTTLEAVHGQALQERNIAWVKWEEAQAERDSARRMVALVNGKCDVHGVSSRICERGVSGCITKHLEASPGEIVKACPRCHEFDPAGVFLLPTGTFHCLPCGYEFQEPLYWQQVPAPEKV